MDEVREAMMEYNKMVKRYKKAEEFFEREDIPLSKKNEWVKDFKQLIGNMDGLIKYLAKLGYDMSDEEINLGFRQVDFLFVRKDAEHE